MKKVVVIAALALAALVGTGAQKALAQSSSCYICDCNAQANQCRFSCQGNSGYASKQKCDYTCEKQYSQCLDLAYAAIKAEEEAAAAESSKTAN